MGGFAGAPARGSPTLRSAPTPIARRSLTFPGSCLPRSLRWDLPGPRRNRGHPLLTTDTHAHGHSSPPLLPSPGCQRNRPESGKVIRFKGPGLEMGAEARGNRDDGRAEGLSRTAPQPPTNTPACSCRREFPAHPVTKGGGRQIPRGEQASVRPRVPGTRPAPRSPQRWVPRTPPPPRARERAGGGDSELPNWEVATRRARRRTCRGAPCLSRRLFPATATRPGPRWPAPTPPQPRRGLCADVGAPRAARASGTPRGSDGLADRPSPGNSLRFLQASSRNSGRRCGGAGRLGTRRARWASKGPPVGQITALPRALLTLQMKPGTLGN